MIVHLIVTRIGFTEGEALGQALKTGGFGMKMGMSAKGVAGGKAAGQTLNEDS